MARTKQIKRLEPWHHRLIDWLVANPEMSGRECAMQFGVSAVWISIVKHSPIFRAEFERRREMISKSVTADIAERATALAELSLDVLTERIKRNGHSMPLGEVRDVTQMALKMLGYPARQVRGGSPAPVTPNLEVVDAKVLAAAREKMRKLSRMLEAMEHEPASALPTSRGGGQG